MDPRAKEMGVRVITPKDSIEVLDNMGVIQDNEMYKAFRYSLCIPEGSELFKRHPISTHLGKFNAIINIWSYPQITSIRSGYNRLLKG